MKICVLVAASDEPVLETLHQLYTDRRNDIELFLYNDGVLLLKDPSFIDLSRHVKTTLCNVSACERGIKRREHILFGSLYDLSKMLVRTDKFISFTR